MNDGVSVMATETSVYAPDGGMWINFKQPWYTYFNPDAYTLPYLVVFLPKEEANTLYLAQTTTGLWQFVLDNPISTFSAEYLATKILEKFGIALKTSQIIFLFSATAVYFYERININSFAKAIEDGSGKVRIDYATTAGWPTNVYSAWNNNYVTNSPWQDFKPVFHRGVYSAVDL